MAREKKHPIQPLVWDDRDPEHGVIRFKENKIVRFLLDMGPFDLNQLVKMLHNKQFEHDDWIQLMQLIGYSVSGFGDLSEMPRELVYKMDAKAEKMYNKRHKKRKKK